MPFDAFPPSIPPVDAELVNKIVNKLKSQGIFDQFRKDCMADVDTKPAYQNLQQRVNGTVSSFLATQTWQQDLNKTQLRESLRRHVQQGFLEVGVDRIVDQVVNPKIIPIFMPKVEDVVYDCLGIEKPEVSLSSKLHSSFITSFPPPMIKVDVPPPPPPPDLLPKDLEPVSPESATCGGETPLRDEKPVNESSTMNHDTGHEDSSLSGISDLSSHIGDDSFRDNPLDSNTVKSISSPKGNSKELQFDNFTNLTEKIKQEEMTHGQVVGGPSSEISPEGAELESIPPSEEAVQTSPKELEISSFNNEAKLEIVSSNSLSTFEDSKTFITNKVIKEEESNSRDFSEDSFSCSSFGIRDKFIPKVYVDSEGSLNQIEKEDKNSLSKDILNESKENTMAEETHAVPDEKQIEEVKDHAKSSDKIKQSRESPSSKQSRSDYRRKDSDSRHRSSKDRRENIDKKDDSKSSKDEKERHFKEQKDKTSKDDKERPFKAEKEKISRDEKERSSKDEKEKSSRDEKEKSTKDEREKISKMEKEKSTKEEKEKLSKDEKERPFKDEKERISRDDKEKSRNKDEKYSKDKYRDRERSSDKHKDVDKTREKHKESDKYKDSDRSSYKHRESEKCRESKGDSKDIAEKDKKSDKNKDKENISRERSDKERSSRSRHEHEKDRHSKEKRDKEKYDKEKKEKERNDKDKEKEKERERLEKEKYKSDKEKEQEKHDKEKEKNRHDRDRHDKEKSRAEDKSKDDKRRESRKNEKSTHSSSSSKKTDSHRSESKESRKLDDNSHHKQNGEKGKIEDEKKDRKRKGERCNDESKSKEARRSSDRDSNGGRGGSSHRQNSDHRSTSVRESGKSNSEKKTKGSSSHGHQQECVNEGDFSLRNGEESVFYLGNDEETKLLDASEGFLKHEESKHFCEQDEETQQQEENYEHPEDQIPCEVEASTLGTSSETDGPADVETIIQMLKSSIAESQEAESPNEFTTKELTIKKPKVAKNMFEIRKLIQVRKNIDRKLNKSKKECNDVPSDAHENNESLQTIGNVETRNPEENKENITTQGIELKRVTKNSNNKGKMFFGFQQSEIEKSYSKFLIYENYLNSLGVGYNRILGPNESISVPKHTTVHEKEELLDNNLNNLNPRVRLERLDESQYLKHDLKLTDNINTKNKKTEGPSEQETTSVTGKVLPIKRSGKYKRKLSGSMKCENVNNYIEGDDNKEGTLNVIQSPASSRTPEPMQSIEDSPESPCDKTIYSCINESISSLSDGEKGLSISLTEDMLNNLMKETHLGLEGDGIDPEDSDYEYNAEEITVNYGEDKEDKCKPLNEVLLNNRSPCQDSVKEKTDQSVREDSSSENNTPSNIEVVGRRIRKPTEKIKYLEMSNCITKSGPQRGESTPKTNQRNPRLSRSSQRYDSTDLYKPRPVLPQNSKRVRSSRTVLSEEIAKVQRDQAKSPARKKAR